MSGQVLVAGGKKLGPGGVALACAELYQPSSEGPPRLA
jgi:hypothetical protein